jgi:hypothetical protein
MKIGTAAAFAIAANEMIKLYSQFATDVEDMTPEQANMRWNQISGEAATAKARWRARLKAKGHDVED